MNARRQLHRTTRPIHDSRHHHRDSPYQVTDVEGPFAAVSSMNDGGMTVVLSPQGAWVCDETPLKPVGSIDLKRGNRTFWMDLPRAGTGGVQRTMALEERTTR